MDRVGRLADVFEPMQLRVARLCLDCEELHASDACPVCGSESYAFLSTWLPSDERRKWRRGRPPADERPVQGIRSWPRVIARWLGGNTEQERPALRTRVADRVPRFEFEEDAAKTPQASPSLEARTVPTSQESGQ